jgi:hypothetical protein
MLKTISIFLIIALVIAFFVNLISVSSNPRDLQPIIEGRFKNAKAVYYPSSDCKVCAVIVDSGGNVWYLRMNGYATVKDDKQLFNISTYKQQ